MLLCHSDSKTNKQTKKESIKIGTTNVRNAKKAVSSQQSMLVSLLHKGKGRALWLVHDTNKIPEL